MDLYLAIWRPSWYNLSPAPALMGTPYETKWWLFGDPYRLTAGSKVQYIVENGGYLYCRCIHLYTVYAVYQHVQAITKIRLPKTLTNPYFSTVRGNSFPSKKTKKSAFSPWDGSPVPGGFEWHQTPGVWSQENSWWEIPWCWSWELWGDPPAAPKRVRVDHGASQPSWKWKAGSLV